MDSSTVIAIIQTLVSLPAILIALTVHEVCHGYMAYRLGDPTAHNFGRLTLNPIKHIDPVGFLCMLVFKFGWAKPVPINTRYFKNPKRDTALTALAGPVSNFILAFIGTFLYHAVFRIANVAVNPQTSDFIYYVWYFAIYFFRSFVLLNIGLGLFNLIPIPPLDGSRIFLTFLPPKAYFAVMKYERYIMLGMFLFIFVGSRFGLIGNTLGAAISWIVSGFDAFVNLIPFLAI